MLLEWHQNTTKSLSSSFSCLFEKKIAEGKCLQYLLRFISSKHGVSFPATKQINLNAIYWWFLAFQAREIKKVQKEKIDCNLPIIFNDTIKLNKNVESSLSITDNSHNYLDFNGLHISHRNASLGYGSLGIFLCGVTRELLPNIWYAYIFKIIINFLSHKSHISNETT